MYDVTHVASYDVLFRAVRMDYTRLKRMYVTELTFKVRVTSSRFRIAI